MEFKLFQAYLFMAEPQEAPKGPHSPKAPVLDFGEIETVAELSEKYLGEETAEFSEGGLLDSLRRLYELSLKRRAAVSKRDAKKIERIVMSASIFRKDNTGDEVKEGSGGKGKIGKLWGSLVEGNPVKSIARKEKKEDWEGAANIHLKLAGKETDDKNKAEHYSNAALNFAKAKKFDDAKSAGEKAEKIYDGLKMFDRSIEMWDAVGNEARGKERWIFSEKARECFLRKLESNVVDLVKKAEEAPDKKTLEDHHYSAREVWEKAVGNEKEESAGWVDIGKFKPTPINLEGRLADVDGKFCVVMKSKAQQFKEGELFEDAAALYHKVLELDKNMNVTERKGTVLDAKECYEKAGNGIGVANMLVMLAEASNDGKEKEKLLREAIEKYPNIENGTDVLKGKEALAQLEKILGKTSEMDKIRKKYENELMACAENRGDWYFAKGSRSSDASECYYVKYYILREAKKDTFGILKKIAACSEQRGDYDSAATRLLRKAEEMCRESKTLGKNEKKFVQDVLVEVQRMAKGLEGQKLFRLAKDIEDTFFYAHVNKTDAKKLKDSDGEGYFVIEVEKACIGIYEKYGKSTITCSKMEGLASRMADGKQKNELLAEAKRHALASIMEYADAGDKTKGFWSAWNDAKQDKALLKLRGDDIIHLLEIAKRCTVDEKEKKLLENEITALRA